MTVRRRVRVMSDRKMVTLHGVPVRHEGEPRPMLGWTAERGPVIPITFDDAGELLVANEDVEAIDDE